MKEEKAYKCTNYEKCLKYSEMTLENTLFCEHGEDCPAYTIEKSELRRNEGISKNISDKI